jgi:hypothetical protein
MIGRTRPARLDLQFSLAIFRDGTRKIASKNAVPNIQRVVQFNTYP